MVTGCLALYTEWATKGGTRGFLASVSVDMYDFWHTLGSFFAPNTSINFIFIDYTK